jgi:hypothetical protein
MKQQPKPLSPSDAKLLARLKKKYGTDSIVAAVKSNTVSRRRGRPAEYGVFNDMLFVQRFERALVEAGNKKLAAYMALYQEECDLNAQQGRPKPKWETWYRNARTKCKLGQRSWQQLDSLFPGQRRGYIIPRDFDLNEGLPVVYEGRPAVVHFRLRK